MNRRDFLGGAAVAAATPVFPLAEWEEMPPSRFGLDVAALDRLALRLGGRGCVIRHGVVVHAWGDQARVGDWASSAKPVLSTLLFFAIEEGRLSGVDHRVADLGWALSPKDESMTFRHLGGMTSGYARPEAPGKAWAYNDFAIQLYQKSLFERVFAGEDPGQIAAHPRRLGPLGFQDGLRWTDRRRLSASVRDFARMGWFWLQQGRWSGRWLLPRNVFQELCRPQVPASLPNSGTEETEDYLGIGTYGGGSNHFAVCGPGIYGFNWWFNRPGPAAGSPRVWPDAPADTFMSIGVRGNNSAMIPSLGLVLVCASGNWDDLRPGVPDSRINLALRDLTRAAKGG